MIKLTISKETALPSPLQANTIYLVAPPENPDYVEVYVTDKTGSKARRHINEADVKALIATSLSAVGQMTVVDNIAARDRISEPKGEVYVIDASADSTVQSGGARYLYHDGGWIKTAEAESMDLALNWSALQGKPSSTPQQIDQAVGKMHEHANQTQLDKIGEDGEGNLQYGGKPVATAWANVGW